MSHSYVMVYHNITRLRTFNQDALETLSAWTAQTEERLASSTSSSLPTDEEAAKAELELVSSLKAEAQIQGGILDRAKGATVALETILKDRLGGNGKVSN